MIRKMNPNVTVIGGNYPVEPWKQFAAQGIGFLQMTIFAIIFMGNGITDAIGISDWNSIKYIAENKMSVGFGTFFLCNNIAASCMQTGAFEVFIDGELKFSKLETGGMPNVRQLNAIFADYGVRFQQ